MPPLPSISRRKHYRTVPGPPSEPTSTLVLTSPQGFYIDIRTNNPPQPCPSPNPKTFNGHLQWAFAGTKTSTTSAGRTISTWHHPIDSLSEDPEPDVGEMEELDNGDILERGEIVNAEGKMVRYEELWEEIPLPKKGGIQEDSFRRCVALKTVEEEGRMGMAMRIGGYCQGILKEKQHGRRVTVERWEFDEGEGGKGWERTVRFGEGELPCEDLINGTLAQEEEEEEGKRVMVGGLGWEVCEVASW